MAGVGQLDNGAPHAGPMFTAGLADCLTKSKIVHGPPHSWPFLRHPAPPPHGALGSLRAMHPYSYGEEYAAQYPGLPRRDHRQHMAGLGRGNFRPLLHALPLAAWARLPPRTLICLSLRGQVTRRRARGTRRRWWCLRPSLDRRVPFCRTSPHRGRRPPSPGRFGSPGQILVHVRTIGARAW